MHTSQTVSLTLDQKRMNSTLDTYTGEGFLLSLNDNRRKTVSSQETHARVKTFRFGKVTNLLFYTEKTHIASFMVRKINGVVTVQFFFC